MSRTEITIFYLAFGVWNTALSTQSSQDAQKERETGFERKYLAIHSIPLPNSSETVSLGKFTFRNSQWAKTFLKERKCIYIWKIFETKGWTQEKKDLVNIYTFAFSRVF